MLFLKNIQLFANLADQIVLFRYQCFFFCELLKQGIDVDILALTVIVIIMCSGLMIGWRHVDVVMKATALDHLKDNESSGNSGRSQDC